MRALIVAQQKTPPPAEMMPMLVAGFNQWRDEHRDKMESFSFFASGNGGCGIVTVGDEVELYRMVSSWPLAPYSHMLVEVLVDGDVALQGLTDMVNEMAGQMGQ